MVLSENETERLEDESEPNGEESSENAASDPSAEQAEPNAEVEPGINLLEALMSAQKEAAEYKDGWQRERADYSNYRKRVERQHEATLQDVTLGVFEKILPLFDDLERASVNIPQEYVAAPWYEGIALIQRKMEQLLTEYEIEIVDPLGTEFDPNIHEAIGIEISEEFDSNQVSETIQRGYICNGRLIRPALVKVAK